MIIKPTGLDGAFVIENKQFQDHRGLFVKTFHKEIFTNHGLETDFKESFYSVSKNNVLRGMHFQLPPQDHVKLVYVVNGEILDVAVDIRKNSKTFGQYVSVELSAGNGKSIYLAKGFAHGFITLSGDATVVYMTTTVHSPEHDAGIRWDCFGFDWGTKVPIISDRDSKFKDLDSILK